MAITLNDNVSTHAPKPVDSRSMDFVGGVSTPFASTAAAIASVTFRHQYLSVWALAANGDPLEYWWRADITDGSLEPKNKESYTLNGDGSITIIAPYKIECIVVIPASNLSSMIIGTTNGGTDLEPGTAVAANVAYTLNMGDKYITTNFQVFFAGLASGTKILVYKKF